MPEILIEDAPSVQPSAAKVAASEILQSLKSVTRSCVDSHQSIFEKLYANPETTPSQILSEIGPRGKDSLERISDLVDFILGKHTGRPFVKMEESEYTPPVKIIFLDGGEVAVEGELEFIAKTRPAPNITKSQLRLWLSKHGITESVEQAIQKLPKEIKSEALIRWECTMVYERNHPLVAAIGMLLNMNSDDLDNLFREAALL